MLLRVFKVHAANRGVQLNPFEVYAIARIIRWFGDSCKLLIFGCGHDSALWLDLNQKGDTVFIEDDEDWLKVTQDKLLDATICQVRYTTEIAEFDKLLDQPKRLLLDLEQRILDVDWNVVIVDAPRGYAVAPGIPGRMQSIFTASKFLERGAFVFVHDAQREVERKYCDRFLGQRNKVLELHCGGKDGYDTLRGYYRHDLQKRLSSGVVFALACLQAYLNVVRSPVVRLLHFLRG